MEASLTAGGQNEEGHVTRHIKTYRRLSLVFYDVCLCVSVRVCVSARARCMCGACTCIVLVSDRKCMSRRKDIESQIEITYKMEM